MHFQNLYTMPDKVENKIIQAFLQHIPSKIIEEDNAHLDKSIEEAKILKSLKQF